MPLFMIPLNLDSKWVLRPRIAYTGSLADVCGAIPHPQASILELNPAETGEHHSVCTRGLFRRLIQQVQQGACTSGASQPRDSEELEKVCGIHTLGFPVLSEWCAAVCIPMQELLPLPTESVLIKGCVTWIKDGTGQACRPALSRPYSD